MGSRGRKDEGLLVVRSNIKKPITNIRVDLVLELFSFVTQRERIKTQRFDCVSFGSHLYITYFIIHWVY